jgi:hypothetical protein
MSLVAPDGGDRAASVVEKKGYLTDRRLAVQPSVGQRPEAQGLASEQT